MRLFYANGFSVSFNKEVFCIRLEFVTPDGTELTYLVMSPEGVKTLLAELTELVGEYEGKYGDVQAWKKSNPKKITNDSYVS